MTTPQDGQLGDAARIFHRTGTAAPPTRTCRQRTDVNLGFPHAVSQAAHVPNTSDGKLHASSTTPNVRLPKQNEMNASMQQEVLEHCSFEPRVSGYFN